MTNRVECDLAILGGGLAGSLIALAFAARRPDVRLALVERDAGIGGNHIWSFFDGDVVPGDRWLVDPLISHRWPQGHDVRFPGHHRQLDTPYNSIASPRLDAHIRAVLGDAVLTGADVVSVTPDAVMLADGLEITAGAVIDARGAGDLSALRCGWQKFVGHTLRLDAPHGIDRPVIMAVYIGISVPIVSEEVSPEAHASAIEIPAVSRADHSSARSRAPSASCSVYRPRLWTSLRESAAPPRRRQRLPTAMCFRSPPW